MLAKYSYEIRSARVTFFGIIYRKRTGVFAHTVRRARTERTGVYGAAIVLRRSPRPEGGPRSRRQPRPPTALRLVTFPIRMVCAIFS